MKGKTVTVNRLIIADAHQPVMDMINAIMASCELCGDDVADHEWVDIDHVGSIIVNCDRTDGE